MSTIYHIENINTGEHRYYGSLSLLLDNHGAEIKRSTSFLQKYNWSEPYRDKNFIIRKSILERKKMQNK